MLKPISYHYKAARSDGKVETGRIEASSESEAFTKLKSSGLIPLKLTIDVSRASPTRSAIGGVTNGQFKEADLEDTFNNLAILLRAGTDIRTALSVIATDRLILKEVVQAILGGSSLETAFGPVIPPHLAHLRGLIAAGEARGDIPSGLEAASKVISTRTKIRAQLLDALTYPSFVFVSAVIALLVILVVVVPAIAPLLEDSGQALPVYFGLLVGLSDIIRNFWVYGLGAIIAFIISTLLAWRYTDLPASFSKWMIDGALGLIVRGLVFGSYARSLGDSLKGGASLTEALRLSYRGLGNIEAGKRCEGVLTTVRQGYRLSEALRQVKGFPTTIIRLCEVGEASSTMDQMLITAGEQEEKQALERIERYSKILGPALIIVLGAMIGTLMASVLGALSDIGSVTGT